MSLSFFKRQDVIFEMINFKHKTITVSAKLNRRKWELLKSNFESDNDEIVLIEIINSYEQIEMKLLKYKNLLDNIRKKYISLKDLSEAYKVQVDSLKKDLSDSELLIETQEKK